MPTALGACLLLVATCASAGDAEPLPWITVRATVPDPPALPEFGAQQAQEADWRDAETWTFGDLLQDQFAGIALNHSQGNPLQPDVQYHGYTASPLLGVGEGLAVVVDGVRVNEAFGDTVNWDLIPTDSLREMRLVTGAAPLAGANALGGALFLRTKRGFDQAGLRVRTSAGAFGRREIGLEQGGSDGSWAWYGMAAQFREDGWRDFSPSRDSQVYSTLSYRDDARRWDLHLGAVDATLTGNGAAPWSLLRTRYSAIFTAPDATDHRQRQASIDGETELADTVRLRSSAYVRRVVTASSNGDIADSLPCADAPAERCDDEEPVRDLQGRPVPVALDAVVNGSARRSVTRGMRFALEHRATLGRFDQRLSGGVEALWADTYFASDVRAGHLDAQRYVVAAPDRVLAGASVRLDSRRHDGAVFLADTLTLVPGVVVDGSVRWTAQSASLADRSGTAPDLTSSHRYAGATPALGLAVPVAAGSGFLRYSQARRAPTPVELSCAEPSAPCRLPNQFLADPPLLPVRAQTWQLGWRSGDDAAWRAEVNLFRAVNRDDILFQTTGGTSANEGFFRNVGATRRQGLDLTLASALAHDALQWRLTYSYLDATYRTGFLENSAHHPAADAQGLIAVQRGDRLPGLPHHSLGLHTRWRVWPRWRLSTDVTASSSRYYRGDETNALAPLGGFTQVDLGVEWDVSASLTAFGRIDNLFDRRYATFGLLGDAQLLSGNTSDPRFATPAAPRAIWVGAAWRP